MFVARWPRQLRADTRRRFLVATSAHNVPQIFSAESVKSVVKTDDVIGRPLQTTAFILLVAASCLAQTTGRLHGVVRSATNAPVAGAVVLITNQVTRKVTRVRTNADGSYAVKLAAGAYRLTLDQPNTAAFDKDKNYGDFAIVRGDTLENVVIEAGKEIVVDIAIPPVGTQAPPQRRETSDRWRIVFPEYDRYGDRGARGRGSFFSHGRAGGGFNLQGP